MLPTIGGSAEWSEYDLLKQEGRQLKDNKILKGLMIKALLILIAYFVVQAATIALTDRHYKGIMQGRTAPVTAAELNLVFDEPDILVLNELQDVKAGVQYTLEGIGEGTVVMEAVNTSNDEVVASEQFSVQKNGLIINTATGNFSGHRLAFLYVLLALIGLTAITWQGFVAYIRQVRYSYHAIFCAGFGLWLTLQTVTVAAAMRFDAMVDVYATMRHFADYFILWTGLPIVIFGILLSVSNLSLIRHEGFRRNNALGIIISGLLLLGLVLEYVIYGLNLKGLVGNGVVSASLKGVYSCIFAMGECFLIGSVICGALAAKHEPALDRDYIVILGCKVRKDGTLYPLIRGRVDRAIAFYQKQLAATGHEAIFVPSGGQGRDETISEAGAMKRYLLEQGIEERLILTEDQSKNTLQNMTFSKKLIEERTPEAKVAFSTTNYHVFRSGIISRQAGFEPDGMGSPTKWYFWPNAYVREVIGMVSYKWKTLVLIVLPIIGFMVTVNAAFL